MSPLFPASRAVLLLSLVFWQLPRLRAVLPIIPPSAACGGICGAVPVKFPFGTGPGCGHPDFAPYLQCASASLRLATPTGLYPVASLNYSSRTVVLSDPLMSTCSSMQNSGSFALDRAAPFAVAPANVFVLLGCSATSPVFNPDNGLCEGGAGSASKTCRGLYSCEGVEGIGLGAGAPISTCCVYRPPPAAAPAGFRLDLPKLQCSSYASIYRFGGDEADPAQWSFGISLRYNAPPRSGACGACENSGGACAFRGSGGSFSCVCRDGWNGSAVCGGGEGGWVAASCLDHLII